MSAQENKTIARRYFEDIWNKRSQASIDELFAATFVGHAPDVTIHGTEALRQRIISGYSEDIHFTIEDVIAEGDKVCVRWMYRARMMDKQVATTGMHLFQISSGKIEEFWINMNEPGA
jgi:predicted SnoaL-like aldol condensation-catalyzing enzyme